MSADTRRMLLEKARTIALSDFVPSPCISVCCMEGASGRCEGCLRTLDEIARWGGASEQEKLAIWSELLRRAEAEP